MIIYRRGSIWDTEFEAVGHGVNTMGKMGAGIAAQFAEKFPLMHIDYVEKCRKGLIRPGRCYTFPVKYGLIKRVFNLTSQDFPGKNAKGYYLGPALWDAKQDMRMYGIAGLAILWIGTGIGGMTRDEAKSCFEYQFGNEENITLEVWEYAE